ALLPPRAPTTPGLPPQSLRICTACVASAGRNDGDERICGCACERGRERAQVRCWATGMRKWWANWLAVDCAKGERFVGRAGVVECVCVVVEVVKVLLAEEDEVEVDIRVLGM